MACMIESRTAISCTGSRRLGRSQMVAVLIRVIRSIGLVYTDPYRTIDGSINLLIS